MNKFIIKEQKLGRVYFVNQPVYYIVLTKSNWIII